MLACQGEESVHQALAAFGGLRHLVNNQFKQRAMAEFFSQEVGMHEDYCQGIIQLVGHTRQQGTHGREFFTFSSASCCS